MVTQPHEQLALATDTNRARALRDSVNIDNLTTQLRTKDDNLVSCQQRLNAALSQAEKGGVLTDIEMLQSLLNLFFLIDEDELLMGTAFKATCRFVLRAFTMPEYRSQDPAAANRSVLDAILDISAMISSITDIQDIDTLPYCIDEFYRTWDLFYRKWCNEDQSNAKQLPFKRQRITDENRGKCTTVHLTTTSHASLTSLAKCRFLLRSCASFHRGQQPEQPHGCTRDWECYGDLRPRAHQKGQEREVNPTERTSEPRRVNKLILAETVPSVRIAGTVVCIQEEPSKERQLKPSKQADINFYKCPNQPAQTDCGERM